MLCAGSKRTTEIKPVQYFQRLHQQTPDWSLQPMDVDNILDIRKGGTRILTDTGFEIAESINKGEDLIEMINGTGWGSIR